MKVDHGSQGRVLEMFRTEALEPERGHSSQTIIVAEGLTKRFGRIVAVDDLSFAVDRGKVTGFLGPNGAGKTTTLRMILGLAKPTAGHAKIAGKGYQELRHPARVVGSLLDGAQPHPARTARDHLRVLAGERGVPRRRIDETLALVDLGDAASGPRESSPSGCASV